MSNQQNTIDQCIALAALSQSVRCVQNVAWKGQTNPTDAKAVLTSLLSVTASSTAAVYEGSFELSSGLRLLGHQIDPQHKDKDPEFVNLAINVITIQQQLVSDKRLLNSLTEQIDRLSQEFNREAVYTQDDAYEDFINRCSDIYKQTLSKLPTRIQVKGEPRHLQQSDNQALVRALLLSAVRACFLWRQKGGSRWHFLFRKKLLLTGIKHLISNPVRA
ncbi:MAG: high frequency lysogenization protein HflD [Kangiellaceae bacterium]|nr:high frequency lysogenization protein HflD [Kangiellaceae bacterium]MCW8998114.1 high frequency lysogenization protein HflD [Kangiellaceae bacterium]